jgi:hypothetical protein
LNTKVSFAGKERIIKIGFYFIIFMLSVFLVTEVYDLLTSKTTDLARVISIYISYAELILLWFSASRLLYQLKKKYNFEYRK